MKLVFSSWAARASLATLLLAAAALCQQQSPSSSTRPPASTTPTPSASPSSSAPPALSTFTSTTTLSRGQALPSSLTRSASRSGSVYFIPVVTTLPPASSSAATVSASSTSSAAPSATAPAAAASSTSQKLPLNTEIDPAFGVLGALLLITGLPMTFYGHRNRWSSYFIAGYYSLGLITICIILKAGVESAVNPPTQAVRGLFLLATIIAGAVGGILCIVFWRSAALLASGLGGFMLGLFLQSVRSGGLIGSLGLRYVLYVPLFAIFFALSCAERIHSLVLALSTAITGATAVTLAIDCYTRMGLKEFYIRNLGFDWLFEPKYPPTFSNGRFPLVQGMQIELGVLGALVIMGTAFQLRLWSDLRHSMAVLRKSDEERRMRTKAERAARQIARTAKRDLEEWEQRHGYKKTSARQATARDIEKDANSVFSGATMQAHERKGSMMSFFSSGADATPLSYNGLDRTDSPGGSSLRKDNGSPFAEEPQRDRRRNSSFMSYLQRGHEKPVAPGDAPPQLQLDGIDAPSSPAGGAAEEDPSKLLEEISNIRKSIEMLRSGSGGAKSASSMHASPIASSHRFEPSAPSSVGHGAAQSLELSRALTNQSQAPVTQSFRQRTQSTAAIMSGAASFLSKSPGESPMLPQGPPTSSNGVSASHEMSPSSSNPGDSSGISHPGGFGGWASQSQSQPMSRSMSDNPSWLPSRQPSLTASSAALQPAVPVDAHLRAASPPVPQIPAIYDTLPRSRVEQTYANAPLAERRMSGGGMLHRVDQSYEHDNKSRPRANSATHKGHHSRVLTKSIDEGPPAAVLAARRSIAARRNDSTSSPWTNPGAEVQPSASKRASEGKTPRKSMTIGELDARHRAKLAALQKPATDSVKEAEMLQAVREEYEKKQRAEKRRMMEREKEREREQALAALTNGGAGGGREGAASPDANKRASRRLSASLLQAVGEQRSSVQSLDRAAEWRRSVSKVPQADPSKGRSSQPPSHLASSPTSAQGPVEGTKAAAAVAAAVSPSRSRSQQRGAMSPTNPFQAQTPKKRELSETDRRRLSQGAGGGGGGGGDRRSRRMSQPLLDFSLPAGQP
ncbi:uncharacterized protein PFL1_00520 [Pseudozyma flocculosa PF-1]|uniref:uncharacterized protein n=1 Tax=Pseudozyma flocculosa PF-1 TaxID=1277687 RepID=UPI00045616AB|nr:uncharacterized protein PFL1_00520 [Pseudozyma flocculosa PF-1]EPQ32324.1 hypothetical protein PFL1_00520 [Pseudozyma flocculosa PF-1]